MRLRRVHVAAPLEAGRRERLAGDAANHIARVLRLGAGDVLTLFDGGGGEYGALIEEVRRDFVTVRVGQWRAVERESPLALTLAQGVARAERMDWVVQKATELGVRRICPILSERAVVRLDARQSEHKRLHWQAIAVAACEQSGRDRIPAIELPAALGDFLRGADPRSLRVLLSPSAGVRIADLPPPQAGLIVLIGPEGGLAEAEQGAALAAGFLAVRLGPRVLRTETAALAALTLLQHRFGDVSA
jgi:16S rRNA (uracil1498-N3)-methyltransferase